MLLFNSMSNSNGQSPFYFNTSNVTIQQTVEYSRCTNLSNFNTSNVTIQLAFFTYLLSSMLAFQYI